MECLFVLVAIEHGENLLFCLWQNKGRMPFALAMAVFSRQGILFVSGDLPETDEPLMVFYGFLFPLTQLFFQPPLFRVVLRFLFAILIKKER